MVRKHHRLWLLIGIVVLGTLGVGWYFFASQQPNATRSFTTIEVRDKTYSVVLASTDQEITQGLSGRRSIGADGMLFTFRQAHQPVFWMFQMRFPLDFVWVRDERIVQLDRSIPPPVSLYTPTADIATVRPKQPVTAVLEVPAGFIDQKGWEVGDTFRISGPTKQGVW